MGHAGTAMKVLLKQLERCLIGLRVNFYISVG